MKVMTVLLTLVASTLAAQTPVASIDPGMTRAQVVATLGEPLSSRSFESYTYLLYKNGCEKKCGMNDLVVLDSGKVVDAVFRSPERKYTGTSSSPRMISMAEVSKSTEAPKSSKPLAMPAAAPKKVETPKKVEAPKKAEPKPAATKTAPAAAKKDTAKKVAPTKTPPPTPKKP